MKLILQRDICPHMFIAALFTIAKIWKQPKCPSTDEWIKMWYVYIMEYYSAFKKVILPSATACMNVEDVLSARYIKKNTT